MMAASLEALLRGVFDYAGMFPPAARTLDDALAEYLRHRAGPWSWMLGRFVCPAGQLGALAAHRALPAGPVSRRDRLRVAVVVPPAPTSAELLAGLRGVLRGIQDLHRRAAGRAAADSLELRLPADVQQTADAQATAGLLEQVERLFTDLDCPLLPDFYEPDLTAAAPDALEAVIRGIGEFNAARGTALAVPAGIKLRCGGPQPGAAPADERLAAAIAACRDHEVPVKFTAGLHHPLRHTDPDSGHCVHGFLNVLLAALLAHAAELRGPEIVQVLSCTAPQEFRFEHGRLGVGEWFATTAQVETLRDGLVCGVGTCSFDEPCQGLVALGLLTPQAAH